MYKILPALLLFSFSALATPPQMPDNILTQGVINPAATVKKLCTPNYTAQVRDVPESEKRKVFAEYKIDPKSDKFEIDHLISLELGGSNDIKNLWPQSYTTQPFNAHMKDQLENTLHRMICKGTISIADAQKQISTNWISAYKQYVAKK